MTDDQLPRPGEIWNACVSVRRGALLAAQMYSAAKLSQSMQQDLQDFLNLQVHGRDRPCIVFSVKQNTVQIFPITRLEGRPRHSVNGHIEHFLVPFGDDEVGNDSQIVIKTTPDWPTSKITPSYVFGYAIDVPIAAIHHKHLRGIEGQTFDVEPDELDKLQHVADAKLTSYKLIPRATMQEYNASWTVKLPWRALNGLSGPASAPPEPLSAARPVRTICMPRLMRGVHVVNYPLFTYPPTIWESQTAAAHPSRSSANFDLGIDQEASDQFPALRSADPAASGQKAASEPGVQSGSAWRQPLMRPREEETAGLSACSQTVTMPPEAVRAEEEVIETTEEAPWHDVPPRGKKKRQSWGKGGAK